MFTYLLYSYSHFSISLLPFCSGTLKPSASSLFPPKMKLLYLLFHVAYLLCRGMQNYTSVSLFLCSKSLICMFVTHSVCLSALMNREMNNDLSFPRNMWQQHDESAPWRSSHGPLSSPSSGPAACHTFYHVDCDYSSVATLGLWKKSGW